MFKALAFTLGHEKFRPLPTATSRTLPELQAQLSNVCLESLGHCQECVPCSRSEEQDNTAVNLERNLTRAGPISCGLRASKSIGSTGIDFSLRAQKMDSY